MLIVAYFLIFTDHLLFFKVFFIIFEKVILMSSPDKNRYSHSLPLHSHLSPQSLQFFQTVCSCSLLVDSLHL